MKISVRRFCIAFFSALCVLQIRAQNVPQQKSQIQQVQSEKKAAVYKKLDLNGADRSETDPYRNDFLKPFGQKKLRTILEEGENYRLYVRSKLKQMKMPAALEYLPVIESEYKPSARSKDGKGVGMWQFMPNSTAPFLTVNKWIDERLDPWKETDAALLKLQDNYNMFGDWLLAIGAYNCGAGAMKRALAALPPSTEKSFWTVAKTPLIPDHTKRYVPKLLAIADLVENAEYYNVNLPSAKNKDGNPVNPHAAEFDYVEIKTTIALRILAAELRIDETLLKELNPSLIYGITPPDQKYTLRLPVGMKDAAQIFISGLIKK